jgi:hypothetical protein
LLAFAIAAAVLALSTLGSARASADFGFQKLDSTFTDDGGAPVSQAGSHPFAWTTTLELNTTAGPESREVPDQDLKDLRIQLPAGLVGTPSLLSRCSRADFLNQTCPAASALGTVALETTSAETKGTEFPVYNLLPQPGSAAELGFIAASVPVTIEIGINPRPPYNLVVSLTNVSQLARFFGSVLTIHGASGEIPFLTLPRSCTGPLLTTFEADSWQEPGKWVSESVPTPSQPAGPLGLDGCADLGFSPRLTAAPTTKATQSPSGLDLSLDVDDEGWTKSQVRAQSEIREATFTLPEGMTTNPAVAAGLGVCTREDLARETPSLAPGGGCPNASKIGTVQVGTPLFEEPLAGSVFVAQPDNSATTKSGAENPFDALLALYVVVKSPTLGLLVDQAAKIDPDPKTGQLVVTLRELPQLPISNLELHLRAGNRSPLQSPPACGTYASRYRLAPWSGNAPFEGVSSFTIDQGCASGGFAPQLRAGTLDPRAGSSSPFVFELSRRDGEQNLAGLAVTLPPGVSARFAGVPLCPEALASSGACPATSRVGSVNVAAGAGAAPLWIPPTAESAAPVYLAGPYKRAPFSFVVRAPAQAGPFDLGTVTLRAAIYVDRRSAQATVRLDPLPQILRGVPIDYRAIHLELDRSGFVRNPTSCEPLRINGRVRSSQGETASPSAPFQASRCGRLGFKPKLALRLLGPAHRGAHPRFRATVTTGSGEANVRRFAATLPATELLDNRHIRTVCSVARFAASACPAGSIYGHAKAWSPLLDKPLQGPVYLRAGNHRLPDLVASLGGQLQIDLAARVDSVRGRLRTTFDLVPDIPLSKVVLTMDGGGRGLFVNTGGLCAHRHRADASFKGQNGKLHDAGPVVRTDCGPK